MDTQHSTGPPGPAPVRRPAPGPHPRSALLPGDLLAADPAAGRRRTARDWLVDCALFGWAVLWWAIVDRLGDFSHLPGWLHGLDPVLGGLLCLSLWWRRSHPLAVTLLAVPAMSLAPTTFGPGMVILLNLGLRGPRPLAGWLLGLIVLCSTPYVVLYSVPYEGGWSAPFFILGYHLLFFAWGAALRARRQLVVHLRQDADRERREHARRLADVRRTERQAIAREMHDVLAHRISLLSVHAGALAYRTRQSAAGRGDRLADAEVAESARVIRDSAHLALEELRDVLQVLRAEDAEPADGAPPGSGTAAPQPTLADIAGLLAEARTSGQQITVTVALPPGDAGDGDAGGTGGGDAALGTADLTGLRAQVQRTAYRVVQEGLTNARKHAPGARVTVTVDGAPATGLTVRVRNALPVGVTATEIPGAGAGLTGLRERVELDSGALHHGSTDGAFTLAARLPWPA